MGLMKNKGYKIEPSAGGETIDAKSTPSFDPVPASALNLTFVPPTLTPHDPVIFNDPVIALSPPRALPNSTSALVHTHPMQKDLSKSIVVTLTMPDLTLVASSLDGIKLANAKPYGDEGKLLSSKYVSTFGLYPKLKGKEIKKTLELSLEGLKKVCGDNLIIFSGDMMTIAGQLIVYSIIPTFVEIIDPQNIKNIVCYLALPSEKTHTAVMKGSSLDVYGTLIGLYTCVQSLENAHPFVFTSQELYYLDEITLDRAKVKVLPNILSQVAYWRINNEINWCKKVEACCVCDSSEVDYFKAKFDAAWDMRAYTSLCKEVMGLTDKTEAYLFVALKKMAKMVDDAEQVYSPSCQEIQTLLPINYAFDPQRAEHPVSNRQFLDNRKDEKTFVPDVDHSLDSPWTVCVVLGVGPRGKEAVEAVQAVNKTHAYNNSLIFAKDFSQGSMLLTNHKKTAGRGWMLVLCDSSWSMGEFNVTSRDYKNVTSKYTQREDFMVVCLCVTPRPTFQLPVEECAGCGRFLSFAMEHIKLVIFTDGFDTAVDFAKFMLSEGNRDLFCPFAMYNFLSPYSDRLSLVELIGTKTRIGIEKTGKPYASGTNKCMLAFCMACGMTVEEAFAADGLLEPLTRTWGGAMADRYGRAREALNKDDTEAFYYTLASSMQILDFLYVIKDKCESSFPKIESKTKSGKVISKVDENAANQEDYKAWQKMMAYTLWVNVMV